MWLWLSIRQVEMNCLDGNVIWKTFSPLILDIIFYNSVDLGANVPHQTVLCDSYRQLGLQALILSWNIHPRYHTLLKLCRTFQVVLDICMSWINHIEMHDASQRSSCLFRRGRVSKSNTISMPWVTGMLLQHWISNLGCYGNQGEGCFPVSHITRFHTRGVKWRQLSIRQVQMSCFDVKVLYLYSNVTEPSGLQLEVIDKINYLSRR